MGAEKKNEGEKFSEEAAIATQESNRWHSESGGVQRTDMGSRKR